MYDYTLTAEELADLRSRFTAGEFVCVAVSKRDGSSTVSYCGSIVRVNDLGEVIVNWDEKNAPPVIVSKKAVKSFEE